MECRSLAMADRIYVEYRLRRLIYTGGDIG